MSSLPYFHGLHGTRSWNSWRKMKGRCDDKNDPHYIDYGGRGISYCEAWTDFRNFFEDMGRPPFGKQLERIDNNKGYYKENCCWATPEEQSNNRRDNKLYEYQGKRQTLARWGRELGIDYHALYWRASRGWRGDKLFRPSRRKYT